MLASEFRNMVFRNMPRPSEELKLSLREIERLKKGVSEGISMYGSAQAFGQIIDVRAPVLSQALHGRLVARTKSVEAILEFEITQNAPTQKRIQKPALSITTDPEVLDLIGKLTRGTKPGKRQLIKMLKAAVALQTSRLQPPSTPSKDE